MKHPSYLGGAGTFLQALPFLLLLQTSTSATAATSYLQELEAEAAATEETSSSTSPSSTSSWSDQQSAVDNGETIERGLSKSQFEEALKTRFYGSYLFYSTLTDDKQQVVYEEYNKNNDIEHLRATIQAQMSN